MRMKTRWFKSGRPRGMPEIAATAAFMAWRIAQQALRNMRRAEFDIAPGETYFDFLGEWLIFQIQFADRVAFERLDAHRRVAFISAMAHRAGDILAENHDELLGNASGGAFKSRFITALNRRLDEYAHFDYPSEAMPYPVLRHFAHCIGMVIGERDAVWVHDQVMEIEGPEAVGLLRRGLSNLLEAGTAPADAAPAGETAAPGV